MRIALVLAFLVFAGCLQSAPGAAVVDAPIEAPAWAVGDWWRVAFEAPPYGVEAEVTLVVADVTEDGYLVGMADALDDAVLLLHFPPVGEVGADLRFEAHDRAMELLRFPLATGDTWTTQWYSGVEMLAAVASVEDGRATVALSGAREGTVLYDAAQRNIVKLDIVGYGGYEVVESGSGYAGEVVVPVGQDLVFCHGRASTVTSVELCAAAGPMAGISHTVTVPAGYDAASLALFTTGTAQDVHEVEVTAPDGSRIGTQRGPGVEGYTFEAHAFGDPTGEWTIAVRSAGQGTAILEGVAYRKVTVELPAA